MSYGLLFVLASTEVFTFALFTESMDDKLSWMEVLNAATESEAESQEKFDKGRKSVRQRLNRRVSSLDGIAFYLNRASL